MNFRGVVSFYAVQKHNILQVLTTIVNRIFFFKEQNDFRFVIIQHVFASAAFAHAVICCMSTRSGVVQWWFGGERHPNVRCLLRLLRNFSRKKKNLWRKFSHNLQKKKKQTKLQVSHHGMVGFLFLVVVLHKCAAGQTICVQWMIRFSRVPDQNWFHRSFEHQK